MSTPSGPPQDASVRIRILGPVTIEVGGREETPGPQQRVLLVTLALARGRPVGRGRLTELMWEGAEPPGAESALRVHIRNLRRVLEPDRRATDGFRLLVSAGGRSGGGYALRVAEHQVDALWFVRLTQRARNAAEQGDLGRAVACWDEALALWNGPALAGVNDRSFAVAEARRLEELRLVAREERIDTLLALERCQEAIDELDQLVREHQLRERLWAQLITALYRSGRQADALAAYRRVYRLLDAEVGVRPGRPLQELHQRILNADPALEPVEQRVDRSPADRSDRPQRSAGRAARPGVRPAGAPAAAGNPPRTAGTVGSPPPVGDQPVGDASAGRRPVVGPGPLAVPAARSGTAGAPPTGSADPGGAPRAEPAEEQPHLPFPAPRQLPPEVASFTGRTAQVRELDALLAAHDSEPGRALVISSLSGTAGVGKTTLAVHWMRRVADRFPEGQLYVDLRGYASGPPVTVDQALGQMLRSLGVPPARLPEGADEKGALYRTLLADKRVMVLLDNAAELDQVRPLLPGSPTCLVVVTSRNDLRGLTAFHDAHRLGLGAFSEDEAVTLLARIVGTDRVREEPEAAVEVVRLCGCLPLAVRITAANLLGGRRRRLRDMARDLREGNRLCELAVEGDDQTAMRTAFDLSYHALRDADRRMFRLLGLAPPGSDVSMPAAAALAGVGDDEAGRALDHLVSRNLVESYREGHYHFHDLLRLYARERSEQEDGTQDRQAAVERLLTWYHASAAAATRLTIPLYAATADPMPDHPTVRPVDLADREQALAWFSAERHNLLAAVEHAAEAGPYPFAWRITQVLHGHLLTHGQRADWLRAARAGLRAAEEVGDGRARGGMHRSLAYVNREMAAYDEAVRHAERAVALFEELGEEAQRGGALYMLGTALRELGDLRRAGEAISRLLEIVSTVPTQALEVAGTSALGFVRLDQGRFEEAKRLFTHSRDLARTYRQSTPAALTEPYWGLGASHAWLGEYDLAIECYSRALPSDSGTLRTYAEEVALTGLAASYCHTGRYEEALGYATAALDQIRATRRRFHECHALNVLASVLARRDDLAGAADHFERALAQASGSGCRRAEATAHTGLAAVQRHLGRPDDALRHATAALSVLRGLDFPAFEGEAMAELAAVRLALGRLAGAGAAADRAVTLHRGTGYRLGLARALETAAEIAAARDDTGAAARYGREADDLYAAMGTPSLRAARAGAGG